MTKNGSLEEKKVFSTATDHGHEMPTASGTTWFVPQYDEKGNTIKFLVKPSLIPSINDHKGDDDEMPRWSKMRGSAVKTAPFLPEELQDKNFRNTTATTITTALHKNSIHEISYQMIQIIALGRENGKSEKVFVQLVTRFSKTPPEALPGYSQVGETILLTNDPFTEYWMGAVNAIGGEYLEDTTLVIFDISSDIALGWVGAQKVFGSLWHTTIQDVEVPNVSFDSGSNAPSYAAAGQIEKPVHASTRPL
jgi:hypothetical protein